MQVHGTQNSDFSGRVPERIFVDLGGVGDEFVDDRRHRRIVQTQRYPLRFVRGQRRALAEEQHPVLIAVDDAADRADALALRDVVVFPFAGLRE